MTEEPDKKPYYAHCDACGYEWAAVFQPMEIKLLAETLACNSSRCPYCGGSDIKGGIDGSEFPLKAEK